MKQHDSRLRDLYVSDDSRLRDLDCPWDPIGGAKSDNIADIVTPSSLTIATMASIYGSDESISNLLVQYQTYPRTAMVDPAVIDVHANKYVDGSLPSTRLRLRVPRNATTQSSPSLIDSDNLALQMCSQSSVR